jgi:methyl-accepting chemotaxis protein
MQGRRVIPWVVAGFLAPPVVWLGFGWYFEIWSFSELLRVIFSPFIWAYVAVFLALVVWLTRRRLGIIDAYAAGDRGPEATARAQRAVNSLPWTFLIVMSIYCIVGPNVAVLGQTLNDPFLDRTEYILTELLGIPLILQFTIPFFLVMSVAAEHRAQAVLLHDERRFLGLRGKVAISVVLNLMGAVLTLVIAALSIVYEGTTSGEPVFAKLVTKLAVTGVVIFVIGLANMLLMIRQIVSPVNAFSSQLSDLLRDLSTGRADLTDSLRIPSRDEIGYLARNFRFFVLSLRRLVSHIQESIRTTARQSEELSRSSSASTEALDAARRNSQRISAQFGELQDELNQVLEAVNEVASFVRSVSGSVSRQNDAVRGASETTTSMADSVGGLASEALQRSTSVARLQEIAGSGEEQMRASLSAIKNLADSAGAIRTAAGVIDDIAERTHLLAMNAAIEAAKAGETGRGFAVVAKEIKDLAESTRSNSSTITESLEEVADGIELTRSTTSATGESFGRIMTAVKDVAALMDTMTNRLQEVAADGRDVTDRLGGLERDSGELNLQSQAMAARVEQIAASLTELGALSETTRQAVDHVVSDVGSLGRLIENANSFAESNTENVGVLEDLVGGFTVEADTEPGNNGEQAERGVQTDRAEHRAENAAAGG